MGTRASVVEIKVELITVIDELSDMKEAENKMEQRASTLNFYEHIMAVVLLNQICFVTHDAFFVAALSCAFLCECVPTMDVTHKVWVSSIHFIVNSLRNYPSKLMVMNFQPL